MAKAESTATRESILNCRQAERVRLSVPTWGGDVWIRELSGEERDAWEAGWLEYRKNVNGDAEDVSNYSSYLLTHTLVDAEGKLLFGENDVPLLGQTRGRVLEAVAREAMRINGIGVASSEDILKNSDAGQNGSSG